MKEISEDLFFKEITEFLNDSELDRMMDEILEIEANQILSLNVGEVLSQSIDLKYMNKLYSSLTSEIDNKGKQEIQTLIATALDVLHIILELIHVEYHTQKDEASKSRLMYSHQYHAMDVEIVKSIKNAILSESSLISDINDNKLIFTIMTYIDFERKYQVFAKGYEEHPEYISFLLSCRTSKSVSSNALKCTAQIIKIWELIPSTRRPSLSSYYHQDGYGLSASHPILAYSMSMPEEAILLLECLSLCADSQSNFINVLFKDENVLSSLTASFCKDMNTIKQKSYKFQAYRRLVGMYIVFMSKLIQNKKIKRTKPVRVAIEEFTAHYLISTQDIIRHLFISKEAFKNLELGYQSEGRITSEDIELDLMDLAAEEDVKELWFSNYVVSSYLLLLCHMLTSLDKEDKVKEAALKTITYLFDRDIHEILATCTTHRQTNTRLILEDFQRRLGDLGNVKHIDYELNSKRDYFSAPAYVTRKEDFLIAPYELQQQSIMNIKKSEGDMSNSSHSTLWSNMWSNFYGYGRAYALDRNEMFYTMKMCRYRSGFCKSFIKTIGVYNLEMSLLNSERALINSIHDMFAFVSSLGHDGFAGSSYDKIPSSIKKAEKEINYDFSFFSAVCKNFGKLTRTNFASYRLKLLDFVGKFSETIWTSLKKDLNDYDEFYLDFNYIMSKIFGAKIDFMKTIFHSKIYLSNLEFSDIDIAELSSGGLSKIEEGKDEADISPEEEREIEGKTKSISEQIIKKLEDLLYIRTRVKSELPTNNILLENIFEFIPIFLNNVVECQVIGHSKESLNKFILNFAQDLRHFFDYDNDKYYNAIVLIYEQLLKVLDDRIEINALFRVKDSIIIKKMMLKITQTDCSEDHYLSTIKFMIAYSSMSDGAVHLFEERITNALISAHLLKDLDEQDYYQGKQRSSKHILWLWTLHLMRQLTSMLSGESDFTYPVLQFITAFEQRMMKVLQFKGYRDSNNNIKTVSVAQLEEIEHTINLISFVLVNYDQWKANKNEQLEIITNILFSYTIGLFTSNTALSDVFVPISQFEIYIQSLSEDFSEDYYKQNPKLMRDGKKSSGGSLGDISPSIKSAIQGKIFSSFRTPIKGEMPNSDFTLLDQDEYTRKQYKASTLGRYNISDYRPNGYMLKVETLMVKISLMLLRSMHLILKNEIKRGKDSEFLKELSYYHERTREQKLYMLCRSIFDCIQFCISCGKKWITKFNSTNKLNKVLNGASQSIDNMLDSHIDIFDALHICTASSELGLLLCMLLLKAGQLSSEDDLSKGFLETSDKRIVEKLKEYSEQCKTLSIDKDRMIEGKEYINRRVYKKQEVSFKTQADQTNSDIILQKIQSDYR